MQMKIAIAQMDPLVGAFSANLEKIKKAYERACKDEARLLLTPELSLCGYSPLDLIERPEVFERNEEALEELLACTRGQKTAMVVGHIARSPLPEGHAAENCVSVLENGKVVFKQVKTLLPSYDIFDEQRYFEPSQSVKPWICDGVKIAIAICEDLWSDFSLQGHPLYLGSRSPLEVYRRAKVQLVVSISASPYEWRKSERRERTHSEIVRTLGVPLVYVNQMGATDDILFDGGSFAIAADGTLAGRLPFFQVAYGVVEVDLKVPPDPQQTGSVKFLGSASDREDQRPSLVEMGVRAGVTGIREYFHRTGFKKAVLGLSGGLDSAVVAALAVEALGAQNVLGVAMPSQFSSSHSLEDAEALAHQLGMQFEVRPIKFLYATAKRELSEGRGELTSVALENLQSRLRGMILMTLSNHDGSLVLATGNKSELAMGYCTLYGDMAGAVAPIGDLFKTRVYEMAREINRLWNNVIPLRTLQKAPSAELRPGQVDQDSLPPYAELDLFLELYIEAGMSLRELRSRFREYPDGWVDDLLNRFEMNEYKRRQAPPIFRMSPKAFGLGRRVPLAKKWERI
jgi:NAD+ synthase (glutamine-hydrolysing)